MSILAKKKPIILCAFVTLCCACGAIWFYIAHDSGHPEVMSNEADVGRPPVPTVQQQRPTETPARIAAVTPAPRPAENPQPKTEQPPLPQKIKKPLQDPLARDALKLVGVDADITEYWKDSIFNEALPKKERADLMEDLNEVGFSNPKHPNAADLELAKKRIALIEQIAPSGDAFMQKHLEEAYKDLQEMLLRKPAE